jgi:FkbM family methyltransferase
MALYHTLKFITQHPLNRGKKIGALVRFLRWQLASRLYPGEWIYRWVNESKMVMCPGETGLTGNMYCGLHDFEEMAYLLHVLRAEDLFVDIGANVGSYTILACAVVGAKGYCFEPVPSTFERLMSNLRINNLSDRVKAVNLGMSDKEGELIFTTDENCSNHVVADGEKALQVVPVKVLPLDSVIPGHSPSLIKIDVEGFETPVLRGARSTLKSENLHSVIMELNESGSRYGFREDEIIKTMSNDGFELYTYEPFSRELKRLGEKGISGKNALFVRNVEMVRERIKQSPQVCVGGVRI